MCTANRVETRTTRMRRRRLSQKRLADCCWLLFLLQGFNTLRWAEGRDANNGRGKRGASDAPPEPEMNIHAMLYIVILCDIFVTHVWCVSWYVYFKDNFFGKNGIFDSHYSIGTKLLFSFFFFVMFMYYNVNEYFLSHSTHHIQRTFHTICVYTIYVLQPTRDQYRFQPKL